VEAVNTTTPDSVECVLLQFCHRQSSFPSLFAMCTLDNSFSRSWPFSLADMGMMLTRSCLNLRHLMWRLKQKQQRLPRAAVASNKTHPLETPAAQFQESLCGMKFWRDFPSFAIQTAVNDSISNQRLF
jgi:hypothetical protein